MTADNKPKVAADIADHCGFRYQVERHRPFDFAQIRAIVEALEGTAPNPGTDKKDMMVRIAHECGFDDDIDRYLSSANGPPPFTKEHLVEIRATLDQRTGD